MSGGYRLLVIALGLVLASNHAYAKSGDKQQKAEQPIAQSLSDIAAANRQQAELAKRADQDETSCSQRQYGSSADLCAQWKAADAASDSAWWAWIAGISTVISTSAVLIAIGLTYQANAIARDTAKRQLRAYVFLSDANGQGTISHFRYAVGEPPHCMINIKNYGTTPAYKMVYQRGVIVCPWPLPDDFEFPPDDTVNFAAGSSLAPNDETCFPIPKVDQAVTQNEFDMVKRGELTIYIWGRVRYSDSFGVSQLTNFCLGTDVNSVSDEHGLRHSHRHNEAT